MIRSLLFSVLLWLAGTALLAVLLAPGVVSAALLFSGMQALPLLAGLVAVLVKE